MANENPEGLKVAILVENGFMQVELVEPAPGGRAALSVLPPAKSETVVAL